MPPRKTNYTSRYRNIGQSTWRTGQTTSRTMTHYSCKSPKYNPAKTECQWRMGSYRNIYSQFAGNNRTAFSPTMANRWIRYVNNGVRVYKFTQNEFTRYFGTRWTQNSPTAIRRYLRNKYGTAVRDVTRGNGNCWLIATTKNVSGRPFNAYCWA